MLRPNFWQLNNGHYSPIFLKVSNIVLPKGRVSSHLQVTIIALWQLAGDVFYFVLILVFPKRQKTHQHMHSGLSR